MRLKIEDIRQEGKLQTRCRLDIVAISEYAQAIREGAKFPPLVVFAEPGTSKYFLADGWHRIAAAKQAGRTHIGCEVREGGMQAAFTYALSANEAHGLRRTSADKVKAVEMALATKEYQDWSLRDLGELCKVSHEFVRRTKKLQKERQQQTKEHNEKSNAAALTLTRKRLARQLTQEQIDRNDVRGSLAIIKSFPYDGEHAAQALDLSGEIDDIIYVRDWLNESLEILQNERIAS